MCSCIYVHTLYWLSHINPAETLETPKTLSTTTSIKPLQRLRRHSKRIHYFWRDYPTKKLNAGCSTTPSQRENNVYCRRRFVPTTYGATVCHEINLVPSRDCTYLTVVNTLVVIGEGWTEVVKTCFSPPHRSLKQTEWNKLSNVNRSWWV